MGWQINRLQFLTRSYNGLLAVAVVTRVPVAWGPQEGCEMPAGGGRGAVSVFIEQLWVSNFCRSLSVIMGLI